MLIIDAHLDLSMNALQGNRDLLSSAYTIRTQEAGMPEKGRGRRHCRFSRYASGQNCIEFCHSVRPLHR